MKLEKLFRVSSMLIIKITSLLSLRTVIKNRPSRVVIYVVSLILFVYIFFTTIPFNLFRKVTIGDIRNFYIDKQYLKVIAYADRIKLQNAIDESKLNTFVILANIKLYQQTSDIQFMYNAINKTLKISNSNLHRRMLKNILLAVQGNADKKSLLLYYYVQNKKYISKKLTSELLRYAESKEEYTAFLHALMSKTAYKHNILYKLSKSYASSGNYDRALKYLKVAKGITNNKQFLARANNLMLLLKVRSKDCQPVLRMLNKTDFPVSKKKRYMYKYFCHDVRSILNTKELKEFLSKNPIEEDDSEFFLLSQYFAIKLLFEEKNYIEVIRKIITVLNVDESKVTDSLIKKEDIILYLVQKFYFLRIPNTYKRMVVNVLLQGYNKLNPHFLLRLFESYVIPNLNIFSYTQKNKVCLKIRDILKTNEKEYFSALDSLRSMYYVFTKLYYIIGNYKEAIFFGNNYVKVKQLLDINKVEIYRLLVLSYHKLGDYKSAIATADEVLTYHSGVYKIKMKFTKLKLQSLKNVDRGAFIKSIESNLKEARVNFTNSYYKYFFREYMYILLDKARNLQYTKGALALLDKLIMYNTIYKELYSEELKNVSSEILKIVAQKSKLNNCLKLSYYFNTFATFLSVIFQNNLSEKLYKFAYCMLQKNKTKAIINIMQNALNIDNLSNLDKFLIYAFLYLAHKREGHSEGIVIKLLNAWKKMYKVLDEVALNTFADMPYSPRRMGILIYGK